MMKKFKIILFGTGSSSEKIRKIIDMAQCEIVGYADNNKAKQNTFLYDCFVYSPNQLVEMQIDYIIIGSIYFDEIYKQLIDLGIELEKIINIYEFIRYQDVALKLEELKYVAEVDVMITGMSYARYGFDAETLKYSSFNVSFNSQDIFYDYCLAKVMVQKYSTLKYALIGLAYYDFQFDLSRSKEKHLVNRYKVITDIQRQVDEEKFEKDILPNYRTDLVEVTADILSLFVPDFVNIFDQLTQNDVHERDLSSEREQLAKTHSNKNYPETLERNKIFFERYLMLLKAHYIKPIIVIHPQEASYRKYFDDRLINEFNATLQVFKEKYKLEIINLFDNPMFSDADFYDVHHLNTQGAKKVSKIVNEFFEEQ